MDEDDNISNADISFDDDDGDDAQQDNNRRQPRTERDHNNDDDNDSSDVDLQELQFQPGNVVNRSVIAGNNSSNSGGGGGVPRTTVGATGGGGGRSSAGGAGNSPFHDWDSQTTPRSSNNSSQANAEETETAGLLTVNGILWQMTTLSSYNFFYLRICSCDWPRRCVIFDQIKNGDK